MGIFSSWLKGRKVTVSGYIKASINQSMGLPTAADIDNRYLKEYSEFLTLYDKLDEKAKKEVLKDVITMTTFNWTDLSNLLRTDTGNSAILKNNIEVVTRRGGSANDITIANLLFQACLEQAKLDYIATGSDIEINTYVSAMERKRDKNKTKKGFSSMPPINNSSNFPALVKLISNDRVVLQNSPRYEQNQIDAEAANNRKK